MARPISDEELKLKKRARRRLVGAVVLVSAVAVILPMVLDSEPRRVDHSVDIQIPEPDSGELKSNRTVRAAPADAASDANAKSEASAAGASEPAAETRAASASEPQRSERDEARRVASESPRQTPGETAKAQTKEPAKAAKETAGAGAYVVQVAALADAAKAKQLQKQMAGTGVRTYTEVITTPSGEVTRVRAGPYSTREAAEKARRQLQKAGLDGKVVPK